MVVRTAQQHCLDPEWSTRKRSARTWSLCAGFLAAMTACGAPGEEDQDEDDVGELSSAITGGTLVTSANALEFSGVVQIKVGTGSVCSGTKVEQTATTSRFITAAHCQENALNQTTVKISNALVPGAGTTFTIASNGYEIHPSYRQAGGNLGVNPYDVASVTITDPTTSIPLVPLAGSAPTAVGTTLSLVGYGCDTTTPSHDGQKQTAQVTVASQAVGNAVHYIRNTGSIRTCSGDSGGAFLSASPRKLTAVVSFGSGTSDFNSRVGNILDWINNPLPPNASALLANQSSVFLTNTGAAKGFCAAAASNSVTAPVGAVLNECDNPNGSITGRPPGLRLQTSATGGGAFQILNRSNGFCLTVDPSNPLADNAVVRFETCLTSATSDAAKGQAWNFGTPLVFSRDVTNKRSGLCLGTSGGSQNADTGLVQRPCGSTGAKWMLIK